MVFSFKVPPTPAKKKVSAAKKKEAWKKFNKALFSKKKKYPARFAQSKSRYVINKAISNTLNRISETKYLPLRKINDDGPKFCTDNLTTYYGMTIGNDLPSAWDPDITRVGGIECSQGTQGNERNGDYIYLKKTHMSLQIDMKRLNSAQGQPGMMPYEFRVVVCKLRRSISPAGVVKSPQSTLFLEIDNSDFGYKSTNVNLTGTEVFRQPLNKRDWVILKDQRFTLSPPPYVPDPPATAQQSQSYYSQKYPVSKNLRYDLPYYKKVQYVNDLDRPTDIDYHYCVFVFAKCYDKSIPADQYKISMRGTTTYQDN